MTETREGLSAAHIRYLLALGRLDTGNGIRSVAIASALGVSKASVHTMMHTLREMEIVEKSQYGSVHLTAAGRKLAETYIRYFDLVSRYLAPILPEEADRTASVCAFMAELSGAALERLCQNIEKETGSK